MGVRVVCHDVSCVIHIIRFSVWVLIANVRYLWAHRYPQTKDTFSSFENEKSFESTLGLYLPKWKYLLQIHISNISEHQNLKAKKKKKNRYFSLLLLLSFHVVGFAVDIKQPNITS